MAGNDIRYNVKVDASGANRALQQFGRAAQQAGKTASQALDDTATAGDQARAALVAMAEAMDAELREAAAAADALRVALGTSADQFDADQVVADLNRMGVSFDEIRGDADQFATTLRQIDGIRVQQVNDGLTKTKDALDGVRSNADQSRSVLANMAGNAAQDLGQLGGVAGTAGVAIGQLAEYATEGNISLRNLAGVAGPMLGIAAATQLVSSQLQNMKETDAFNTEQAERYAQAIADAGTEASTLTAEIQETGEILGRIGQDNPMGRIFSREETVNVVDLLNEAGVTLSDISRLYDEYGANVEEGSDRTDEFQDSLRQLGVAEDDISTVTAAIAGNFQAFNTEVAEADRLTQFTASDMSSMGRALAGVREDTRAVNDAWAQLIDRQYNGTIRTREGLAAWQLLRDELGLTDDQMAETFDAKYNDFLDEQATKLAESRDQVADLVDGLVALRDAAADYQRIVSGGEWGRAGIEGATAAYEKYRHYVTGDRQQVSDSEEAWDNLGGAIEGAGEAVTDLGSPEGRAVYDALDELGSTIVPELAKAFDDSDGDINKFRRTTDKLATDTMRRLQSEFNLSEEDAAALFAELGLLPEQLTTFYELSGDEEAKLKLDLLQGSIDALPENVETQVTQKILLGDYQGALAIIQAYYNRHGATVPVDADVTKAIEALRRMQAIARATNIVLSVAGAQSTSRGYSVAPTSAAARGVGVGATAATVAPVNVHIHTAVVGDRYDVQRVVGRAASAAVRLGGRRPQ